MPKFNVGDRVKILQGYRYGKLGDVLEVTEYFDGRPTRYIVFLSPPNQSLIFEEQELGAPNAD